MADEFDDVKSRGQQEYDEYKTLASYNEENDIPSDDLLPHDSRSTQSLSEGESISNSNSHFDKDLPAAPLDDVEEDMPLQDVPDADEVSEDSPVDPVSPPEILDHGIDIINGYDGTDEDV
ncbi:hypothetical protein J2Z69_001750 [Paenibacillus shirakamiensis]|uniref:Uncharacterized protein n=1 Tax=Paenibacillus shirakamiensis TaxID=1265935 RepID=A0ABS4JG79_9BACL|nr:hypothetical protein [Paenibacillus shirakamiensis]MBP2000719.1 hypothetical protein [Paenibacillus shirakamiensis]